MVSEVLFFCLLGQESNKFLKLVIVICKTLSYNVTEFDLKKHFLIRKNTLRHYIHTVYIQFYDEEVDLLNTYTLGIDIGSTTVKIAILDENEQSSVCRLRTSFCKHSGNTG